MSKNTRWALALVGVVIIIVGAVLIGTGKDNTDATQEPTIETTAGTGATQTTPVTPQTGSTGSGDNSGGAGTDNGDGTGGASPSEPGQDSGGASPDSSQDSGGAKAQIGVVSPILSAGKVRTIKADKGETVTIRATATTSGEMHVHGYDKEVELEPGEIVKVKFKANIDGEFPIEFHLAGGEHADVGILQVSP